MSCNLIQIRYLRVAFSWYGNKRNVFVKCEKLYLEADPQVEIWKFPRAELIKYYSMKADGGVDV
jgi:hypothetical protein